jgi:hypothetical protein
MPMRQTIGISLAFLMISASAPRLNPFHTKFHTILRPPAAIRRGVPFLVTTAVSGDSAIMFSRVKRSLGRGRREVDQSP